MTNPYYTASGQPSTGSKLTSPVIRAEFALLAAGFDKLPTLTGHDGEVVRVAAGGAALESVTTVALLQAAGSITFAGALSGITDLTTTGNTILGNASTDTLNVGSGGLIKDASGNVGVGIAPAARLHVDSAGFADEVARFNATTNPFLSIYRSGVRQGYLQFTSSAAILAAEQAVPLELFVNGSERMRIDSSGNVSIGTTTAQAVLHVASGAGATSGTLSLSGTTGASYIKLGNKDSSGSTGPSMIVAANRILRFGVGDSHASAIGGAFTEYMQIDGGNVGIGISPINGSIKLSLSDGTIRSAYGYKTGGVEYVGTVSNHPLALLVNDAERVRIDASGNVGIGTTSISYRLDVVQTGGSGATVDVARIFASAASTASARLLFGSTAQSSGGAIRVAAETSTASSMYLQTAQSGTGTLTDRIVINSIGNVGIGTSPSYRFDVDNGGTSGSKLFRFGGTGITSLFGYSDGGGSGVTNSDPNTAGAMMYLTGQEVRLYTAGTSRLSINSAGDATFSGVVIIGSSGGILTHRAGGANSGYIEFVSSAGNRQGYVGNSTTNTATDGGTIPFVAGTVAFSGNVTATAFSGAGSSLTSLNASNLGSGTVPDARFPATLPALSGVNLTALNANNLGSGTVPDARFPATLPALSGANLTALNASNLSSGTVPSARLPITLSSGTYTPVVTGVTNIASVTAGVCQYMRVGSVVTVSGRINIDPTATFAATAVGISLPIASALTATQELAGTAANGTNTNSENLCAQISADATNDRAQLEFYTVNNIAANNWFFSFTYQII